MPAGNLTVYAQWIRIRAGLEIEKSADKASFSELGEKIIYTYKVTNIGNVTIDGPFLVVDDKIGTIDISTVPESLAPGGGFTITAVYEVTQADLDAGFVTNAVSVIGGDEDLPPGEDEETVYKKDTPALRITKSANRTTYTREGQRIIYTITVKNTGDVTLTGIEVNDPMIADLDGPNGDENGNDKLDVGETWTYTGTYETERKDIREGKIVNTATVKTEETDPITVSETIRYSTSGGGGGGDKEIIVPPEPPALEKDEHFAYIIGYPDNTVRPQGNITREEVAAVFYRLLESSTRDRLKVTVSDFPDVEANRWSSYHIATLANGNIILGYPDGTFRPGNYITRAEIATIASKFDKLTPLEIDMFSDVSGHWAEELINSAAQKGWVTGYPDGTFKPDQYITRAEFVTLVNNVLERRVKAEDILPEARQFPDLDKDAWYYEAMQEAINSHDYIRKPDGYEEWTEIYYPDLDM